MPRVLFDKNVPYPLKRYLTEYQVRTAEEAGWGEISNGELIGRAEKADYQVLVTCDQNVRYQQNMARRQISMVVLGSNIWPAVRPKVAEIIAALKRASPSSFEFIEIAPPPKRRRVRGRSI
ncbi:MAG TPA: hypothetical protein VH325_18930 [Bryobacteraceae bacterium]|jgi:hypothetical protein|nr:hypothetical protein [Bryobacteraceae bacterium]